MALDASTCYRALAARDARFDGRFFTGVTTTGIYCRPVCPAKTPHRENVRFFPCAAAAEKEGFRACRRCRPDAAPGTPAWAGTSATVARALRLISDGILDERPVEALSGRLGVGERHLRRLFRHELGASPAEIAATRRIHFARRLLRETELPVADVAFSAGFGSIRRFNEAFREAFDCTPGVYRRTSEDRPAADRDLTLRLPYQPPYRWGDLARFLSARAIPGVESFENGVYRRSFTDGEFAGALEIRPARRDDALELRVPSVGASELLAISARARRLFDVDADVATIARDLARDRELAPDVRRAPGIRVPGCWDPFEIAVRAVLGQQVTISAATTLVGRLVRALGRPLAVPAGAVTHLFPRPADVAGADLGGIGVPGRRAAALRALAGAFARGEIDALAARGVDAFVEGLTRIPGIGPWTAHYVAMRALSEPDAFPAGDLWLRRLVVPGSTLSEAAVEERSAAWRPWRAYAAFYLWRRGAEKKERTSWKSAN
ncbi:MAG TPA: AlkA N-terminal domain-containing protein [Thermoanaerobaculia bacterium]|nr:AlkA N-terminal domain-containing protein [Thermoanaerobaculia bacterium]